ncbi:MAG TPA: hypothetical protein VF092_00870 [Longimicrobium sp.]
MRLASTLRAAAAAVSLALLAACGDSTGSTALAVDLGLRAIDPFEPPAFTATSNAAGTIVIEGFFGIGGCDEPRATAHRQGDRVVFELELRDNVRTGCNDLAVLLGYAALVRDVPPGTYHLRVHHVNTLEGSHDPSILRPDGVRLETDVTVH